MTRITVLALWSFACHLLFFVSAKQIPNFAGPYRLLIHKAWDHADGIHIDAKNFTFKVYSSHPRPQQTQFYRGYSVLNMTLDDDYSMNGEIAKWANNQWKRNAFVINYPRVCSDAFPHIRSLMEIFFGKDGEQCPIYPKIREIQNVSHELVYPTFPVFPYGRWLYTAVLKNKRGQVGGVISVETETIPRV